MAAPHVTRTDDETLAAIAAGHEMAGMAMSADGEAAARRIRPSADSVRSMWRRKVHPTRVGFSRGCAPSLPIAPQRQRRHTFASGMVGRRSRVLLR